MIKRHMSRQVSESDSVRRVTVGGVWPAPHQVAPLEGTANHSLGTVG